MKNVKIEGLNITVEIDETKPIAGTSGGEEIELYITPDNRLISYDDASNMWVQIWPGSSRADAMVHIND